MRDDYKFHVKRKRPEDIYDNASDYFKGERLTQYANSKSMMRMQEKITIRTLEILELKGQPSLILDAGCGPGFTSTYLKEIGYKVVALDLISEFLNFYEIKKLNPILTDMCFPPFRRNTFDAIISISALQWIFKDIGDKHMEFLLINMAKNCYNILKPNSKAVLQFYPKNSMFLKEIGKVITENTRFEGNFIIDNPNNPKKRTIFLLLEKNQ